MRWTFIRKLTFVCFLVSCSDLSRHLVALEVYDDEGVALDSADIYMDGVHVGRSDSQGLWIKDMVLERTRTYDLAVRKESDERDFAPEHRTYSMTDDNVLRFYLSSVPKPIPLSASAPKGISDDSNDLLGSINPKDSDGTLSLLEFLDPSIQKRGPRDLTLHVMSRQRPVEGVDVYALQRFKEVKVCTTNRRGRCFLKDLTTSHLLVDHRAFQAQIIDIGLVSSSSHKVELRNGNSFVLKAITRNSGAFAPLSGVSIRSESGQIIGQTDLSGYATVPINSFDQSLVVQAPQSYEPQSQTLSNLLAKERVFPLFVMPNQIQKVSVLLREMVVADAEDVNPLAIAKLYRHLLLSDRFELASGGYELQVFFEPNRWGVHIFNSLSNHVASIESELIQGKLTESQVDHFFENFQKKFPFEVQSSFFKSHDDITQLKDKSPYLVDQKFNVYYPEYDLHDGPKLKLKHASQALDEVSVNGTSLEIIANQSPAPIKLSSKPQKLALKHPYSIFGPIQHKDQFLIQRLRLARYMAIAGQNKDAALAEFKDLKKQWGSSTTPGCENWNRLLVNIMILEDDLGSKLDIDRDNKLQEKCLSSLPREYVEWFEKQKKPLTLSKSQMGEARAE